MGWKNILKLLIWLISHGTTLLCQKERVAQQGNRSRGRAQLQSFVGPFMKRKVLPPFKVGFSQNCQCQTLCDRLNLNFKLRTSTWLFIHFDVCFVLAKGCGERFQEPYFHPRWWKAKHRGPASFYLLHLLLDHLNLAIFWHFNSLTTWNIRPIYLGIVLLISILYF